MIVAKQETIKVLQGVIVPNAAAANFAIDAATQFSADIPGTNEWDLVARLVAKLPEELVSAWGPLLTSGSMHVSSAFCHHQPQVAWSSSLFPVSCSPELTDLVITVVSRDKVTKKMTERVLLIQAKTSNALGAFSLTQPSEHKQRHMYALWDPFVFKYVPATSCVLPPPKNLTPLNILNEAQTGARYAGVCHTSAPTWMVEGGASTWSAKSKSGAGAATSFQDCSTVNLLGTVSLGHALVQMYDKTLGGSFVRGTNDWSTVIEYLFEHASTRKTMIHVKHSVGATPVPLASASAFLAAHPSPFERRKEPQELRRLISRLSKGESARIDSEVDGGKRWDRHYRRRGSINFAKGFGIIRIMIDGTFGDG